MKFHWNRDFFPLQSIHIPRGILRHSLWYNNYVLLLLKQHEIFNHAVIDHICNIALHSFIHFFIEPDIHSFIQFFFSQRFSHFFCALVFFSLLAYSFFGLFSQPQTSAGFHFVFFCLSLYWPIRSHPASQLASQSARNRLELVFVRFPFLVPVLAAFYFFFAVWRVICSTAWFKHNGSVWA